MSKVINNCGKLIAELMMAHYENGIECFDEFFDGEEEISDVSVEEISDVSEFIRTEIGNMYDNNSDVCVDLRLAILQQLVKELDMEGFIEIMAKGNVQG